MRGWNLKLLIISLITFNHKLLFIFCTFLFISCTTTIKSPATQIEYTGVISEKGISITAKPPFWGWCVDLYQSLK